MRTSTWSNRLESLAVSGPDHRSHWTFRLALPCALTAALLITVGCSSRSLTNAPVDDRSTGMSQALPGEIVKPPLPGAENAGKPGYYMVKPGDTMIRIGLENGQNWHDIARWNSLDNPNQIEVGQVVRVIPPAIDNSQVVSRPVTPGSVAVAPVQSGGADRPAPAATASGGDENVGWIWPAQGTLVAGFDEAKNKGLDISGKTGDAVVASADGRVVYSGAGLRGYGNLIILKHNNTFLTAYAHNKTLLVKEDQTVKRGQKIAEMGSSDSDKTKLHFEIRRQGKPVDPAKYLPAR
ncbi:MAG: peptidoglycan DD-metalloendopeptidase family protein [Polaromonas sp.]